MQKEFVNVNTPRERKVIDFVVTTVEVYSKNDFFTSKSRAMYTLREDCRAMIKLCKKIPVLKDNDIILKLKFYIKKFDWTWHSVTLLAYIMEEATNLLLMELEE